MSKGLLPDFTPLRVSRGFRLLFASQTITALGAQATEVAVLVQAKQLTGSPLVVGLLGVAELVPMVVFGLYGGVLADRFDRRVLARWCEAGLGGGALLLLVNASLPHPAVWPLFALVAVMMAISSLQRPSLEASIPRLVAKQDLTAAAAVMSMSQNANFILGSALGGVLAVTPGPWLVYGIEAAGFAASFCFLTLLPALPATLPATAGADDGTEPGPALREIATGLRYAISRKDLLGSYVADLTAMILAYPNALFPFVAADLHASWSTGLMFAAPSVGALATTAMSGWMSRVRRHGLAIALAAGGWGLAIAAFGLSRNLYLAIGCLIVAGVADMISGIFRDTLWNQTIPDELRGRLAGVELLSYGVGPSVGQVRSGVLADLAGARFSLVSGGLACTGIVALICALLPAFVRYRAVVSDGDSSLTSQLVITQLPYAVARSCDWIKRKGRPHARNTALAFPRALVHRHARRARRHRPGSGRGSLRSFVLRPDRRRVHASRRVGRRDGHGRLLQPAAGPGPVLDRTAHR
jgi:MFS family permease